MTNKQKLELTWIGKEKRPRLEPRILLEDPEKSYHAKHRVSADDNFDNRLIFGDNLLALKALEAEFSGKVKCVFIDPPYNTGSAFKHYDDGLEHSIWLGLMRDRLEIIRRLLSDDGSLWITIDDNEAHYLKVLCDEVFGRANFVANVVWQKRTSRENRAAIGSAHDHVLLYAKLGALSWKGARNTLAKTYSSPSAQHVETSCVAAINERGVMKRMYPVPFRLIEEKILNPVFYSRSLAPVQLKNTTGRPENRTNACRVTANAHRCNVRIRANTGAPRK